MTAYEKLIPENIAPIGARRIGLYNLRGERILGIFLGCLAMPHDRGEKQYSFGALSDVHITRETAVEDFQRALTYLNNDVNVAFTCICGDLTDNGTDKELLQYKSIVDQYSANTPVYAISGNHEAYQGGVTDETIQPYTGHPLYYSFAHGEDVFIMCGTHRNIGTNLFAEGELQWIYETLEENRNKRCFVFFHVFPWGDSGNAGRAYTSNIFSGQQGDVFVSLMQHYKNATLFHGHSHLKFYLQKLDDKANYSTALGFRSVHIPSITVPRDADIYDTNNDGIFWTQIAANSEGHVVDVYKNGIHLRGRDFVKGEFLPIASYWLDTTRQAVEANTYTDSTGLIITG
jgi:predicted phosphodiesterase